MGSSPSQIAGTNTVEDQQCDKHIQTSAIQTTRYANQAKHSKKSDTGESTITRNENSENTPLTTEQGTLKKDANGFQTLSVNEENDITDDVLETESNESNSDDEDVISSLADTVLSRIQEDINTVMLHVDFKEKVAVNKAEVRDLLSGLKEISVTYINKDCTEFHVGLSDILIKTELIKAICNITINDINIEKEKRGGKGLLDALSLAWNTTNVSDDIRQILATFPCYLETIKTVIETQAFSSLDDDQTVYKGADNDLLLPCLSIVNNISRSRNNSARLRKLELIRIYQKYLHSSENIIKLVSLSTLACIVTEDECHIISAAIDCVVYLLAVFQFSLKGNRTCEGWSSSECGEIIRHLAQNDGNKQILVELGALPLLVKLGTTGNKQEQIESVQAIWALCFDKDVQKKVVKDRQMGVVEFLIEMKKSDDVNINKPCRGALWTLRTAMKQSDSKIYREYALQMEAARTWSKLHGRVTKIDQTTNGSEDKTNAPGHIMISYNSSDRGLMTKIRDRLRTCGYTVWMDVDEMTGSTTEAMAEAVENSLIVLICLSEKYKNSHFCHTEAEYANELRKTIIPLKTERDYKPNGWLGFVCAAKLFFDFSGKYPTFEEPMSKLLKEIDKVYSQNAKNGQKATTNPVSISHPGTYPTPGTNTRLTEKTVKKWTASEVQLWLQKYDLIGVLPDNITAGEIALLLRMEKECQEFFYKCVQDVLQVKGLLPMSKVVWALDEISS